MLHCGCGEIVKKAKPCEGDLITSPQILHFKNTKTTFEIPHVSGYLKKYQNIKSPPFSTLNWLERGTETTAPGKHSEWDQRDDSADGDAASGTDDASLAHTHTHTHISLKRNELKKKKLKLPNSSVSVFLRWNVENNYITKLIKVATCLFLTRRMLNWARDSTTWLFLEKRTLRGRT